LALQVQLVVWANAFVMVSTVWSVSCSLFFYSRCPTCPAICKSGRGHVPPCPMESVPVSFRRQIFIKKWNLLPLQSYHWRRLCYVAAYQHAKTHKPRQCNLHSDDQLLCGVRVEHYSNEESPSA